MEIGPTLLQFLVYFGIFHVYSWLFLFPLRSPLSVLRSHRIVVRFCHPLEGFVSPFCCRTHLGLGFGGLSAAAPLAWHSCQVESCTCMRKNLQCEVCFKHDGLSLNKAYKFSSSSFTFLDSSRVEWEIVHFVSNEFWKILCDLEVCNASFIT